MIGSRKGRDSGGDCNGAARGAAKAAGGGKAGGAARAGAASGLRGGSKVRSGAEMLVERQEGGTRRRGALAAVVGLLLLLPPLAAAGALVLAPQDSEALLYEAGAELADLSAGSGLAVAAVTVAGRGRTSVEDLRDAIGVHRGDPILFLDIEEVRQRVVALPWVEAAAVERRLPDTLHVRISEREPFVRWQNGGRTVLIDREGVILARAAEGEFRHLRRLVGKGAPQQATALFDILQGDPELFARVSTATRVRERRWDVTFDNGVVLRLPEEGTRQAWQRFTQLQAAERLLDKDVKTIDLRVADRVILQLTPEAAQARSVPGKNT